jgi:benzoate membrane transport protein
LIFLTALAPQYSYPQVLGGLIFAGLLVLLLGALGLSERMAALVPAPIVFGILAGSIMPFVVRVFTEMTHYPLLIGATLTAYVFGRRFLPPRVPAILPALLVAGLMAGLTGEIARVPDNWSLPVPAFTAPSFSWSAIISISPAIAIFVAVQSNLTTSIYLRSQNFRPFSGLINVLTGGGTTLGAFLGAAPISSGSAVIALVAGPDAGEHRHRYRSVYLCGTIWLLFAVGASVVATLPSIIPLSLLFALAGIALISVLTQALVEITRGPLLIGPLFAFVVSSSQFTLLGLGPLFWALVTGMTVTLVLEKGSYAAVRTG